eukprot:scaffold34589_cov163-Skeletonema_dohrnii-CCMP3373.AAC.4
MPKIRYHTALSDENAYFNNNITEISKYNVSPVAGNSFTATTEEEKAQDALFGVVVVCSRPQDTGRKRDFEK